jgi:hypothetical protein
MKNKFILYVIILALLLILSLQGILYYRLIQDKNRIKQNFEQLSNNMPDKSLLLTKSEFKKYSKTQNDTLLNLIMDSVGLKYKHITETFRSVYEYNYDTTIHLIQTNSDSVKKFVYNPDPCVDLVANVFWYGDSIEMEKFNVRNENLTAYYWQRVGRRGNKTFFPFGRKTVFAVTKNLCKGETTTEKITISKKGNR